MDIGTLTAFDSDNMYVGLKSEGNDHQDAVINWGDNQVPGVTNPGNGPDHLRFIFTSTTTALTGQGDPVSQSQDGLEIARMEPNEDANGLPNSYGKMGVGNFYNGGTALPVTHKLHVKGNARFEFVPTDPTSEYIVLGKQENGPDDISLRKLAFTGNGGDVLLGDGTWGTVNVTGADDQIITTFTLDPITNILTIEIEDGNTVTVDLTDLQDGTGTDDQNLTGATLVGSDLTIDIENGSSVTVNLSSLIPNYTADNGMTVDPLDPNNFQLGQINTGTGVLNGGQLLHDTEIPMNGSNLLLPGGGTQGEDGLVLGNTLAPVTAKFVSWNDVETIAVLGISSGAITNNVGTQGVALNGSNSNIGARGIANMAGGSFHTGIRGLAAEGTSWNMGADLDIPATTTPTNYGYHVQVVGTSSGTNYGGVIAVNNPNSGTNFGLFTSAYGGATNYGVYSSVSGFSGATPPTGPNYAGYFNGDVYISGSYGPSDINMKTNIQSYDSALYVIDLLEPKTFEFTDANFQGMNLANGHQYGLIAQEVELVLPAIVSDNVHPAEYDTLGNVIHPEYNFKGVNYEALIPVLIGGIKEQQSVITSQDSVITNLNDRLTSLENCLSGILPYLCELSNTAIERNDEETQNAIVKELAIELNNAQSIVIGQNVPNPFAEQTVIEYSIPAAVQKAQILFYDVRGHLINTVEIEEMGNGRLTVFGNDLSTGTYTYTLVADGQIIATKKMVKTN
jgi:hypothetical protein